MLPVKERIQYEDYKVWLDDGCSIIRASSFASAYDDILRTCDAITYCLPDGHMETHYIENSKCRLFIKKIKLHCPYDDPWFADKLYIIRDYVLKKKRGNLGAMIALRVLERES